MPLEFENFLNNCCESILASSFFKTLADNPASSAFITALIIILIILLVFREVDNKYKLSFKAGFWIFILLFMSFCVHDYVLMRELSEGSTKKLGQEYDSERYVASSEYSPLHPRFSPSD